MRKPSAVDYTKSKGRGVLSELSAYDEDNDRNWQVDIRSCDLTNVDLSDRLYDLMFADFDSKTIWPESIPESFHPDRIMELGMDPGLGVRELHRIGITGKGIGIAIIDQALLVNHLEYKDQLRSYEEIHWSSNNPGAEMHGPAVASIAAGKNVGVAPDADLYFIACRMGTWNTDGTFERDLGYLAQAIDRIISINRTLPAKGKIRVISVSLELMPRLKNYDLVNKAIQNAEKEGIVTLHVASSPVYGMGREPIDDPNLLSSYSAGLFWKNNLDRVENTRILVPMDSRCTASPTGDSDYVFYRSGGMSWVVPYLAGLYALACQCNPAITFSDFWDLVVNSSVAIEQNGVVIGKAVQPKFIRTLQP